MIWLSTNYKMKKCSTVQYPHVKSPNVVIWLISYDIYYFQTWQIRNIKALGELKKNVQINRLQSFK